MSGAGAGAGAGSIAGARAGVAGETLGPRVTARAERVWLGLILTLATLLRFYYIANGGGSFWDENMVIQPAMHIAFHGHFRPKTFAWGALAPTWAGLCTLAALHISRLSESWTGRPLFDLDEGTGPALTAFPSDQWMLVRGAMALASIATVWIAFRLGRKLHGTAPALTAAALVAVSYYHVVKAQEATADTVLTFAATLTLLLAVRALERPTLARFLAAGAGVGLTVSAKYNGWAVGVAVAVAALLALPPSRAALFTLAAAATAVLVFVLIDPYHVAEWRGLLSELRSLQATYDRKGRRGGHRQRDMPAFLWATVRTHLVGLVPGVLAGYGALAVFARRRRGEAVVASFVLAYSVWFTTRVRNPLPHNFLLLTPALAVLAAGVLWRACDRALGALGSRLLAPVVVTLGLAAFLGPMLVATFQHQLARTPGTDFFAPIWLAGQLPPGARVFSEGAATGRSPIPLDLQPAPSIAAVSDERLLAENDYLLLDLGRAAELGRFPALARRYRALLLDPRLEPVAILAPYHWYYRGSTYGLLHVTSAWTTVAQADVPLLSFRFYGAGNHSQGDLWLRGDGSTARAVLPLTAARGEAIEVEVEAGGDGRFLAPDGAMALRVGTEDGGALHAVDCGGTRVLRSGPIAASSAAPEIELAYGGDEGGRVWVVRVTVRRLVAATGVWPARVRLAELEQLARAGFLPLSAGGEPDE